MSNSIKLTTGYVGTNFTRRFTIGNVADSIASNSAGVKAKIQALNTSLAGGTSDSLDSAFLSDDFDAQENIGKLKGITAAQIDSTEVIHINLSAEEEEG